MMAPRCLVVNRLKRKQATRKRIILLYKHLRFYKNPRAGKAQSV